MTVLGSGKHNAPALAAEEQQRGDNLAARIVELGQSAQSVGLHQLAARDAYTNAAHHSPQPDRSGL